MSDLADFLLERIAEDEQNAATVGDDVWSTTHVQVDGPPPDGGKQLRAMMVMHLRCRPSRVIAECSAKRLLVEYALREPYPVILLQMLARPYNDHPDFREEWRP